MSNKHEIDNSVELETDVIASPESLDEIAIDVASLYIVNMQSETLLDLEEPEDREVILGVGDKKWDNLAQKHMEYSEKIIALRKAIKSAKKVQWSEEPEMRYAIMEFFRGIPDEFAQCFLTDILMYRASRESGEVKDGRSVYRELVPMFEELGIPEDQMFNKHALRLSDIAKSVLTAQLHLEPQSKSRVGLFKRLRKISTRAG